MNVLVDTNVVSFAYKHDSRSILYEPHLKGNFLLLSFMTLAELQLWTIKYNWGEKRKIEFAKYLDDYLIIYPDEELCRVWGEVKSDGHKQGKPISTADAWVAAVALLFDIPLVTHNRRDFINVANLKIISEE